MRTTQTTRAWLGVLETILRISAWLAAKRSMSIRGHRRRSVQGVRRATLLMPFSCTVGRVRTVKQVFLLRTLIITAFRNLETNVV